MARVERDQLDNDSILHQPLNSYAESLSSYWQRREVTKEDELEIHLLVAEKIQEIYSSYGPDSKESEKILVYLERTGKSLYPEDYEIWNLDEIVSILPDFVVEEHQEDIFGAECGLFSNLKKI